MNRKALLSLLIVVLVASFVSACSSSKKAPLVITVALAPAPPGSLEVSFSTQLGAQVVNDTAAAGVDWAVTCTSADCGSFSPAHTASGGATTYTAPATVPTGVTVTVTATSTTDATASQSSAITITPLGSNASLTMNGQYAFLVTGVDANGFYSAVGSMTSDGNGNITGGEEDFEDPLTDSEMNSMLGTYTIGPDGQGTITVTVSDPSLGVGGVQTFGVTMTTSVFDSTSGLTSNVHALITSLDSSATSSGTLDLQDSAEFSFGVPAGSFVFTTAGWDLGTSASTTSGGVLVLDGAGNLATGSLLDLNDAGTSGTFDFSGGTYTTALDGNGRGAFTSLGLNYVFYLVNFRVFRVVETDATFTTGGSLYAAAAPASSSGFDVTQLSGNFVFNENGQEAPLGPTAFVGQLDTDGAGNISSGFSDINEAGTVTNGAVAGTYAVPDPTEPRAIVTITSGNTGDISNVILYLADPANNFLDPDGPLIGSGALLMDSDVNANGTGLVVEQSPATFQGNFAIGLSADTEQTFESDLIGQGFSDGTANIAGTASFSSVGNPPAIDVPVAFTFVADPTVPGRFTGTLTVNGGGALTMVYYQVSSTQTAVIEVDSFEVVDGYLIHQ